MPDGGRIINLGSVLSHVGVADQSAYTAAKHAVLGFTRAFALHAAARNGSLRCLDVLLPRLASDATVYRRNNSGDTALNKAVRRGYKEFVFEVRMEGGGRTRSRTRFRPPSTSGVLFTPAHGTPAFATNNAHTDRLTAVPVCACTVCAHS